MFPRLTMHKFLSFFLLAFFFNCLQHHKKEPDSLPRNITFAEENCWYRIKNGDTKEYAVPGLVGGQLNASFKYLYNPNDPANGFNETFFCDFSVNETENIRLTLNIVGDDTLNVGLYSVSNGEYVSSEIGQDKLFYDLNNRSTAEVVPISDSFVLSPGDYTLRVIYHNDKGSGGYFKITHEKKVLSTICEANESQWYNTTAFNDADLKNETGPHSFSSHCGKLILGDPSQCNGTKEHYSREIVSLFEGNTYVIEDTIPPEIQIQVCLINNPEMQTYEDMPYDDWFHIKATGSLYFNEEGEYRLGYVDVDDIAYIRITTLDGTQIILGGTEDPEHSPYILQSGSPPNFREGSLTFNIPRPGQYRVEFYLQEFTGDATANISFIKKEPNP